MTPNIDPVTGRPYNHKARPHSECVDEFSGKGDYGAFMYDAWHDFDRHMRKARDIIAVDHEMVRRLRDNTASPAECLVDEIAGGSSLDMLEEGLRRWPEER